MLSEIQCGFRLVIEYANRLVDDIPADRFTAQVAGIRNHPSWILGHLCCSFQAVGGEIGLPPWLPQDWCELFGTGSAPSEETTRYPSKPQLLATFRDSVDRIDLAINSATAEHLAAPLPDEDYRKILPTLGHALVHILIGHTSVHVGQLTAWRAAMGLPHVGERFDRMPD